LRNPEPDTHAISRQCRPMQTMAPPARRRLAAVSVHVAAAATPAGAAAAAVPRRFDRTPARGHWRVGDRFTLTRDDEELVRLCKRVGVGYEGGFANGWNGTLLTVERGNPVAWVQYDGKPEGSRDAIPLAAAGRMVELAPGEEEPDGEEQEGGDDDALMDEMIEQLALVDELPLVVMDAMVPGQTLSFVCRDSQTKALITRCLDGDAQTFGMIGIDPASNRPLYTGVEVEITNMQVIEGGGAPGGGHFAVEIAARRQFQLSDGAGRSTWRDEEGGYLMAHVTWSEGDGGDRDSIEDDGVVSAASELPPLIAEWERLVRAGGHERTPGHLDQVLKDIGPQPATETPGCAPCPPNCPPAWLAVCLAAWLPACLAAWLPGCLPAGLLHVAHL
jgi:hypothetical protein